MKILTTGHSMVHQRQQWFFKKLGKIAGHCIVAGPEKWGKLRLKDSANKHFSQVGLPVVNEQDVFNYYLYGIDEVIKEFKPDIVYCQAELCAVQTQFTLDSCEKNNIPLVVFLWENIFAPKTDGEKLVLDKATAIICGNEDCKKLLPEDAQKKSYILPQVGIELDYFKPYFNIEKKFDVAFCGRPVVEKGIEVIKGVCKELNCSLQIIHDKDYEEIPKLLCESKISASLPITTQSWKEQSGSYSNLEAMACGLPVITTRCGAITEYLGNSALYCEENDLESFKAVLETLIFNKAEQEKLINMGLETSRKYCNENIATKLLEILIKCISATE